MGTGGGDGVVAGAVASARARSPKTPSMWRSPRGWVSARGQGAYDVLESGGRVVDGELELADLPGVLDQAQFGQRGGQCGVAGGVPGRRQPVQAVQVRAADSGEAFGLGEVGTAAHPEFAVPPVAVELVAVAGGAGAQIQDRLVAVRPGRFEDQRVTRLVLPGEAGQPGVGAVRAETVVAVVGADLQLPGGYQQSLAREERGEPGTAGRCDGVGGHAGVGRKRGGRPAGAHEGRQLG